MKKPSYTSSLFDRYSSFKNQKLTGRYITFNSIAPEMEQLPSLFSVEEIGTSVLEVPIHSVTFGTGPVRILAWSQMHGNESTTTRAVFDLLNLFGEENTAPVSDILDKCTIKVIPMLNPDGAVRYTRTNVNEVDLNRDAKDRNENESQILRAAFDTFNPDFCLNLHDQRTIFSAGNTRNPATLSFLAPSMDEERSIPENRKKAMQVIAAVNREMQNHIPGQVGRYDDAFNLQCTGDSFQSLGVPTILFEAGHFQNDYLREKTREFVAMAIFTAVYNISTGDFQNYEMADYLEIPENRKNFYDFILRNAAINGKVTDVAIQFEEKIKSGKIDFDPVVRKIGKDLPFHGHQEIDCKGSKVENSSKEEIHENAVVHQILLKNKEFSIINTLNL